MQITSTKITPPKAAPPKSLIATSEAAPPPEPTESFVKVAGSVGAMAGALTGRVATVAAGAVAGAKLGGNWGVPGAIAGGIVGAVGGGYLEAKSRVGRVIGGMIGGVAGVALGGAAQLFGAKPSQVMGRECRGFSLKALPGRLSNTFYTSHPLLTKEQAAEGMKHVRPGDIIITNDDGNFQLELLQKFTGGNSNWTHNYMVDNDGTVMDILMDNPGPTRWPVEHAFTDNCHALILRPKYQSEETLEKTLQASRDGFGKISYDMKFDLKTDDAQYCQEYAYKALQKGDPSIKIEPRSVLGKKVVTAQEFQASKSFDEVWSTGSNFWINWLSHFN